MGFWHGGNCSCCQRCWRRPRCIHRYPITSRSCARRGHLQSVDTRATTRSSCGPSLVGAKPGDFVAPTIRVAPGQRLKSTIDNRLEPCTDKQRADHSCFNDTNLHTHGLWVSPSGHSDNVLISIAPGEPLSVQYDIPADHPAGTFWYHPASPRRRFRPGRQRHGGGADRHRQSPADREQSRRHRYPAEGRARPAVSRSG